MGEGELSIVFNETVFYADSQGLKITNESVASGKKVHELSDIKSFRVHKYPKSKKIPTIMTVCGVLLLAINIIDMNTVRLICGAFVFIIGVYDLLSKPMYVIRILTVKGEYPILKSRNSSRVEKVDAALKAALAMREGNEAN